MNNVFREIKVYDVKGFECRFIFFTLRGTFCYNRRQLKSGIVPGNFEWEIPDEGRDDEPP